MILRLLTGRWEIPNNNEFTIFLFLISLHDDYFNWNVSDITEQLKIISNALDTQKTQFQKNVAALHELFYIFDYALMQIPNS